jgi:hypothetical protein
VKRHLYTALTATFCVVAACNPSTTKPMTNDSAASTTGNTTSGVNPSSNNDGAPRGHVKVIEATQDSDALSLIRTRRLEAKADNRVLIVYVSATWCEPCKKFKVELDSGRLDDRLGSVTLLAFDADKDIDRLGSAGYTFKFVPFVALPGADGRPTDKQEATGKGGQAWRELLGKLDAWQQER